MESAHMENFAMYDLSPHDKFWHHAKDAGDYENFAM